MKALWCLGLAGVLLVPVECGAKDRAIVCARHQYRDREWSKVEKVRAMIASGSELNQASGSSHYNSLSTYVIIDLEQDTATIIEMSLPQLASVAMEGKDQDGRRWQVARTTTCF